MKSEAFSCLFVSILPMSSHLCESHTDFRVWLKFYLLVKLSLPLMTRGRKDVPNPRGDGLASCGLFPLILAFLMDSCLVTLTSISNVVCVDL